MYFRLLACVFLAGFLPDLALATDNPSSPLQRSYFYVGGHYTGEPGKEIMKGQMYVEALFPPKITHPHPIVLIHGAAQTATNWMGTPDGRPGWSEYFVSKGYVVYMIDQPARGRSAWHQGEDGNLRSFPASAAERFFTATAQFGLWPQARKHTQWPGTGRMGDRVFDAFFRTQVAFVGDETETQLRMREAGAALLDRIGPAILLTHSQGGPLGWVIADARPGKVKGIVAIEPSGPPFENVILAANKARPWGVTDTEISYDPPAHSPSELQLSKESAPDYAHLHACTLQREPARQLKNLKGVPTLLLVAEASYHSIYDHCTAKYLRQAGVPVDFVRLEDRGLKGNGHMVMLEKNNLEIAALIDRWASNQTD